MDAVDFTVEREPEAARIADILIGAAGAELRQLARLQTILVHRIITDY